VLTASLVAKMQTAMAPAMQQVHGANLTSSLSNQAVQLAQLATFFAQAPTAAAAVAAPRIPLVHSFNMPPPIRPQPVNPFTAATYRTAYAVLRQAAVQPATTPATISAAPTLNLIRPKGNRSF
jgi:hypothetical protein